jgi:hypothetical protein
MIYVDNGGCLWSKALQTPPIFLLSVGEGLGENRNAVVLSNRVPVLYLKLALEFMG